ncbi:MAG: hypothetical protein V4670_12290 [Bacteroidota bacterium]
MENAKDIKRLEITLALLLMFVPLILRLLDGTWRPSISNYAYSNYNYVFALLLTLAGTLFLYNGLGFKRHWYNGIIGVSLIGVVLTPHLDYPILHYSFASTFFLGSVLAIGLSSNIAFRGFKYLVSAIVVLGLIMHFAFGTFSLLVAEWIGIIPISTHFIIKSINK